MVFKINDVIIHGTEGICKIIGIEEQVINGICIQCFVLKPEDGRNLTIYIPTKNQKLLAKMRKISSKKEVDSLIDSLSDSTTDWIEDVNERKLVYSKILSDRSPAALVAMIKALHFQEENQAFKGKQLRMSDKRFLKDAEQLLYNEWQYVLKMDRAELTTYISTRMKK